MRHVGQKPALQVAGALQVGVEPGELVGLILEERRRASRLGGLAPGAQVRRLALAGDRQAREGDLQGRPLVGRGRVRRAQDEQGRQSAAGAQRHERQDGRGRAAEAQFLPCLVGGTALQLADLGAVTDQVPHDRASDALPLDPRGDGRRPLVGVEARQVQHHGAGPCGRAEDVERLAQAGRLSRRRVQRGQQPGEVLVHPVAPGEARGHAVDAAGDDAEFVGCSLGEPFGIIAGGDLLQRSRDLGERLRQATAVVPQSDREHHEHGREDHRGGRRGLDGVIRRVGGEVSRGVELGFDGRGRREALRLLQLQG